VYHAVSIRSIALAPMPVAAVADDGMPAR